ncbi:MAG: DNRLRE domain-containing protein [Actinobacteria bacterium]|nr:DNRLRE domain-containing protein [Actinomycetota bacterium]
MSTFVTWTSGRNVRARQRFARRAAGSVLAAVIAALGLIMAPLTATAAEAELQTAKVAWYFDSTAGTSKTGTVGVEVPDQSPPPANPTVPPDTLPAGMQNAEHQYRSAIKFDVSTVPAGAQVDSFTIALHENSSSGTVTGLEACAFTADFAEGGNQNMKDLPEFSCIFSAQGQKAEEDDPNTEQDETAFWIFDMADTAQSWLTDPTEGGIQNHGLVIQYIPPPNLQVGEPDPTQSSGRIFFDGPESETPPVATIEYTVGSGEQDSGTVELEPAAPPAQSDSSSSGGTDDSSSGSGVGFASSPQFESQPSQSQPGPEIAQEPAPEVADDSGGEPAPETAEPAAAPASQQVPVTTPAYVWALIPIGFAALYVLSRSLTAEPQVAVEREGVMTRLIERRRAEASSSSAGEPLMQV